MTEVLKSVDLCFMDILIFEKFRSSFSPGFGFFSI